MYNNPCPICNKEMEYKEYCGEHGLEESHESCDNGCYSDEYCYGSTRTCIFDKEFHSYHSNTSSELKAYSEGVKKEIAYWKENDRYLMILMLK